MPANAFLIERMVFMKNPFNVLNKFEYALWIISMLISLASFIISPSKDIMTIISSLIGVTALIFIAKGHVAGQILTVIFAVFYGIISFFFRYYGEMITYLGMTAPIALMSVVSWIKHPYKDTSEVKVEHLNFRKVVLVSMLTFIVTTAFYFILKALGNTNLMFSTLSVATSFAASFLTFLRSPYYALAYALNDIVLVVLWVLASIVDPSYFPMIVCFSLFLVNDIYGFISWRRMKRRQSL